MVFFWKGRLRGIGDDKGFDLCARFGLERSALNLSLIGRNSGRTSRREFCVKLHDRVNPIKSETA
jgi:hypothetical protein